MDLELGGYCGSGMIEHFILKSEILGLTNAFLLTFSL